jgi:hypothetical protein
MKKKVKILKLCALIEVRTVKVLIEKVRYVESFILKV